MRGLREANERGTSTHNRHLAPPSWLPNFQRQPALPTPLHPHNPFLRNDRVVGLGELKVRVRCAEAL
jgi:hypothetical protein